MNLTHSRLRHHRTEQQLTLQSSDGESAQAECTCRVHMQGAGCTCRVHMQGAGCRVQGAHAGCTGRVQGAHAGCTRHSHEGLTLGPHTGMAQISRAGRAWSLSTRGWHGRGYSPRPSRGAWGRSFEVRLPALHSAARSTDAAPPACGNA